MATVPSSTLQISNALFLYPLAPSPHKPHLSTTIRATPDSDSDSSDNTETPDPTQPSSDLDSFENRLSQIRVRYRSGTGKKAEVRKSRKSKKGGSSGTGIYLPPVPLKEPVSGGLKVDFGFSPYSERVNGRVAILGLSALVLVELATGKSLISYHSPGIVFVQLYFVAAVSGIYAKYEKEMVSVWPQSSPTQKSV